MFYCVLLGFTGFYWVLLGFTGFYWVLLGFTNAWPTGRRPSQGKPIERLSIASDDKRNEENGPIENDSFLWTIGKGVSAKSEGKEVKLHSGDSVQITLVTKVEPGLTASAGGRPSVIQKTTPGATSGSGSAAAAAAATAAAAAAAAAAGVGQPLPAHSQKPVTPLNPPSAELCQVRRKSILFKSSLFFFWPKSSLGPSPQSS